MKGLANERGAQVTLAVRDGSRSALTSEHEAAGEQSSGRWWRFASGSKG